MSHNSSQKSSQSQPSSQQTVSSDNKPYPKLHLETRHNLLNHKLPFNNELNDLLIIRLDEQILGKEDFNHERVVVLLPGRTVDILIR
jgi:hypothetical protein